MEHNVVDNTDLHRFEIRADGELAGFMMYRLEAPGLYALTHTQTLPAYTGQGIASELLKDVLGRVRAGGHAILPYCPFVNSYLRKHPEEVDLVPDAERRRFGVAA